MSAVCDDIIGKTLKLSKAMIFERFKNEQDRKRGHLLKSRRLSAEETHFAFVII